MPAAVQVTVAEVAVVAVAGKWAMDIVGTANARIAPQPRIASLCVRQI
jgi:hypothetical protein